MRMIGRVAEWMLMVGVMSPAILWGVAPQASVETGVIEGKREGSVNAFLGIPYAAAPVGQLRWKPPAAAAKWDGIRKAKEFGTRCMQARIFDDMVFRDRGPSENCLTLNVWAPANAKAKAKLPVMVWIHGGGFVAGGTSEPRQDGHNLEQHGVVVVSMNYRLGLFGFFTHAELAAESEKKAAGNYGLLDQVAALEWVQRNIAAFGGDPGNVTIFGESAGSFSVSALMASPMAKGLFHKAIGESGAAFFNRDLPFESLAQREQEDTEIVAATVGAKSLAELRAVPAEKLLQVSTEKESGKGFHFSPDIDGYFLPEPVPAIFAAGKQNDVPLLAGWNRDEGSLPVNGKAKSMGAELKTTSEAEFGGHAAEFLKLYRGGSKQEAARSLQDFLGDQLIAYGTWKWMEAQKTSGKQAVYRYRFDLSLPSPDKLEGLGAYHSAEIEYVFGQLDSKALPWRPEDRALSAQMQKYWTNFARNGDPNVPGLPKWPAYSADGWEIMYLNARSKAGKDGQRARYQFLDQTWAK